MFRDHSFHGGFDNGEGVDVWKFALQRDRDISRLISGGHINAILPRVPPGGSLPGRGSLSAQFNPVQGRDSAWYLPEVSRLTTQPAGYLNSPLASSSFEEAKEIVAKAKPGPFDWADRYSIDLLKSGDNTGSKFKPTSVLTLPSMEKFQDRDKFSNIKDLMIWGKLV